MFLPLNQYRGSIPWLGVTLVCWEGAVFLIGDTDGPVWLMLEPGHLGPAPLLSPGSEENMNSLVFPHFGEKSLFCYLKEVCSGWLPRAWNVCSTQKGKHCLTGQKAGNFVLVPQIEGISVCRQSL